MEADLLSGKEGPFTNIPQRIGSRVVWTSRGPASALWDCRPSQEGGDTGQSSFTLGVGLSSESYLSQTGGGGRVGVGAGDEARVGRGKGGLCGRTTGAPCLPL